MNNKTKHCIYCGDEFEAVTAWHKACSRSCQNKARRRSAPKKPRYCKQCGVSFDYDITQHNRQHCSAECAQKSARESRSAFWKKQKDPNAKRKAYDKRTREKIGADGNLKRFRKRYPDAPTKCQACGEGRVLDIAHKPEFERKGAWRSKANTERHKVWILCPTCHALLDRMNYKPSEIGLGEETHA